MGRMTLCLNCLMPGAIQIEIANSYGERESNPITGRVDLCDVCASALTNADFATLADRQADERYIRREQA